MEKMLPVNQKSMVLVAPRKMEPREFPIPDVQSEDMLLKVDLVSICGGDPIEYEGKNVKAKYPMILGHEMVGTVASVGESAQRTYGVAVDDRVTVEPYILCRQCEYCLNGYYQLCTNPRVYGINISCDESPYLWGAYGEYLYVAPGSKVHRIFDDVPDEAAALSSVLGNGIRWIRTKAEVKFGETVVVLGAGAQGLVSVIAAKEANARRIIVVGKEKLQLKWDLAKDFGADHLIDLELVDDPVSAVKEINDGKLADVVVECTGASSVMELGLDIAKPCGRVVLVGTTGFAKSALTTDKIVFKELTVLGGLGQSWDTEIAVDIINSKKYQIERMVTDVFPLNEADQAINYFMNNPDKALRVAIKP